MFTRTDSEKSGATLAFRLIALALAILLPAAAAVSALLPARAEAGGTFTVEATELDGIGDDDNGDGMIFLFEGESKKDRIVSSEDHNLRYMFLLVFDRYGSCVQIGNNLVFASVDAKFQNYVVIPQSGFLVAFYYNDTFSKNLPLYNYYKALDGVLTGKTDDIYNRTLAVESDFTASFKGMNITLQYGTEGTVTGDCTETDPDGQSGGDGQESSEDDPPPEDLPDGAIAVRITGFDVRCSNVNGEVDVLYNEASVDEEFLSDDWNFRYMHVMAFGKDGICTQSGNNLVTAAENKSFQNSVKVPAGGFLVAFFYNASEAKKNEKLFQIYDDANMNSPVYNSTIKPVFEVSAKVDGNYLIIWISDPSRQQGGSGDSSGESGETASEDPSGVPDDPSSGEETEEPIESNEPGSDPAGTGSDGEPGQESGEDSESREPDSPASEDAGETDASPEPALQESSEDPSSQSSSGQESGGLPVPVIILLCVAGAAVIATVAVLLVVRKKRGGSRQS
ncbi:MAG: hypothetical protein ILO68_05560 [Clostridia bacterium]|nr:hypothetical protein [Clostridia bacterium]